MNSCFTAVFVFFLTTTFWIQSTCADIRYHLVDLGSLGGPDSRAFDVNNSGDVVGFGYIDTEENAHAFMFSKGNLVDIHRYGLKSAARGINENGIVIGHTINTDHLARATMWTGEQTILLGPTGSESVATAINSTGYITGRFQPNDQNGNWHAFRYSPSNDPETLQDIGTLGGPMSAGQAINSAGTIVGYSLTSSTDWQQHAFIWTENNQMQDLGTLGGQHSQANGINDSGIIVGWSTTSDERQEAFIYSGSMHGLGRLGGHSSSANSINELGDIVGWWSQDGQIRNAFIRLGSDSTMTDLNELIEPNSGWNLVEAYSINDQGWIVGFGIDPAGIDRGFLLVPVPNLNTISCIFGGIIFVLRRRR